MITKVWKLQASIDGSSLDYEQDYTVTSETGDPTYKDELEVQTIAEKHGCSQFMLVEK